MPYRWSSTEPPQRLELWPHRSLPPQGFATFIIVTACMLLIPLLAVLGSPVLWGLLPFLGGALWAIWYALRRSDADGALREDLTLAADTMELVRCNPRGDQQSWQANPYWVRVEMHATGGPVANYLTLKGGDRAVELGAFLSPEERAALFAELQDRLRALNRNAH
ncbi:DUF2244 domain-containing protein [Candidatus Rhodobacter oscarellae]